MSVVSVNRLNAQSAGEKNLTITEVYLAVLDDANTPLSEIMNHPGMPQPGQAHEEYGYLFVLDRQPQQQQQDARLIREVEIQYGQFVFQDDTIDKILQGGDPITLTQPEQRPPVYAWRTMEVLRPERTHRCTTRDGEVRNQSGVASGAIIMLTPGSLLRNTAGIAYEPPLMVRSFNRVLTARRFESFYDDDFATSILFHANSATFVGKEPYTVLCTMFDAETVYVNDGSGAPRLLYLVNYQFEYNPRGHWEDLPNDSAMEYDGTDLVWITDANDDKVAHPVNLNPDGTVKTTDDLSVSAYFVRTFPYEETDLNVLGIG